MPPQYPPAFADYWPPARRSVPPVPLGLAMPTAILPPTARSHLGRAHRRETRGHPYCAPAQPQKAIPAPHDENRPQPVGQDNLKIRGEDALRRYREGWLRGRGVVRPYHSLHIRVNWFQAAGQPGMSTERQYPAPLWLAEAYRASETAALANSA